MLHLGDDGVGSQDNLMDEISLPLSLSAGVLYIIQRFLNQVDENDVSDDDNWIQQENGVVEVNLEVNVDDSEEERPEEPAPTSGEGDMQTREPQVEPQARTERGPRVKKYRMPWTRTRRSHSPSGLAAELIPRDNAEDPQQSSSRRARSRSPLVRRDARSSPSPPPSPPSPGQS